jgi:4-amino-4-deoxy-L-arabinose transferase-like glycosyltransferase
LNPSPRFTPADWLLVITISLLALALRVPQLNHGIWFDEAFTLYKFVQLPTLEILIAPFKLNNHLFYSLAARASIVAFGESVWAIRLPALLFGVATVPALYYLARQLGRRDVAALGSLFLAVSYHHVWFSQNARGYTGLALGTVLASIFILKILEQGISRRNATAYVAIAVFSAGVHPLGALVIIAHAILCGVCCWPEVRQGSFRRLLQLAALFLAAGLLTVAIYGASLANLLDELHRIHAPETQLLINGERPGGWLGGLLLMRAISLNQNLPGGLFSLYVVFLVMTAGIWDTLRRGRLDAGLVLLPIAVTVAVVTAVSAYFLPRFYFAVAPLMILLATRGGFSLGEFLLPFLSRRGILAAGCMVALVSALTVPAAWRPKQDFEGLDDWLQPQLHTAVKLTCSRQAAFVTSNHLGIECPRFNTLAELQALEQPEVRMLVIVSHLGNPFNKEQRAMPIYMSRHYRLVKRFEASVHAGTIEVYERDPLPAD